MTRETEELSDAIGRIISGEPNIERAGKWLIGKAGRTEIFFQWGNHAVYTFTIKREDGYVELNNTSLDAVGKKGAVSLNCLNRAFQAYADNENIRLVAHFGDPGGMESFFAKNYTKNGSYTREFTPRTTQESID